MALKMNRMKKEIEMLTLSPPHGINCSVKDDNIGILEAKILGPSDSPYDKGVFKVEVIIPERYPFEPPKIKFLTPIYHPNIDNAGRICLDSLKMPPLGNWKPALNISAILSMLRLLMSQPNPNDPLVAEIADEYRRDKPTFVHKARAFTERHAMEDNNICEPVAAGSGFGNSLKRHCSDTTCVSSCAKRPKEDS